jgi:hypothetical protein
LSTIGTTSQQNVGADCASDFDSGADSRSAELPGNLSSTHRNDWRTGAMISSFTIFVIPHRHDRHEFVGMVGKSVPQGYEWTRVTQF